MAEREFAAVDAYPIRSFRLEEAADYANLRILRLSSGPDGEGQIHSYIVTSEMLEALAKEFLRVARELPRTMQS